MKTLFIILTVIRLLQAAPAIGTVIASTTVPADSTSIVAVTDAIWGRDGWRSVTDTAARNAIPAERRRAGMVVFTTVDSILWQLRGGIANSNWKKFSADLSDTAAYSIESGHSTTSDTADTALHTPDSVGKAYHADTTDTSTFAWYSDSARIARMAIWFRHYVGIDTFPLSNSGTTFTESNICQKDDTVKIDKAFTDTFTMAHDRGVATVNAAGSSWSGTYVYIGLYNSQINVMYLESGIWSSSGTKTGPWTGICGLPNGKIIAVAFNGKIYRSDGGFLPFDSIAYYPALKLNGCTSDTLGNVYYGVYDGGVYIDNGGDGVLTSLSETTRYWARMSTNKKTNDIIAATRAGGVFKRFGGAGGFTYDGLNGSDVTGCTVDTAGNVFACLRPGKIQKQAGGTGSYSATKSIAVEWTCMYSLWDGNVCAVHNPWGAYIYKNAYVADGIILKVHGGGTYIDGEIQLGAVPITTSPSYVFVQGEAADKRVKKCSVTELTSDSSRVAGTAGTLTMPVDTCFLTFADSTDSTLGITGIKYDKTLHHLTTPGNIYHTASNPFVIHKFDSTSGMFIGMGDAAGNMSTSVGPNIAFIGTAWGGTSDGNFEITSGVDGDVVIKPMGTGSAKITGAGQLVFDRADDFTNVTYIQGPGFGTEWGSIQTNAVPMLLRGGEVAGTGVRSYRDSVWINEVLFATENGTVVTSSHSADSLKIGALTGTFRISNDSLFIKTSATDSLCFKAVAP